MQQELQQLKLGHAMLRSTVSEELSKHTKSIELLRARIDMAVNSISTHHRQTATLNDSENGSSVLSATDGLQKVLMLQDVEQFRRDLDNCVTAAKFDEVIVSLHGEMQTLRVGIDLAGIKASCLAVASTEFSVDDRAKVFDTLQSREMAILQLLRQGQASEAMQLFPTTNFGLAVSPVNEENKSAELDQEEFTVVIDKTDGTIPIGLHVHSDKDRSVLKVTAVVEGLVKRWNDDHPGEEVLPHHEVVKVNGNRADAKGLLSAMEQGRLLTLTFVRPRNI